MNYELTTNNYYYDIVFNTPLRQSFTYFLQDNLVKKYKNLIGFRVIVDFGRQKNKIGVVVGLKDKFEQNSFEIKPIKEIIDETQFFDVEQLNLGKVLSEQYFVSLGEFLDQFFPFEHMYKLSQGIVVKEQPKKFFYEIDKDYVEIFKNKNKVLFVPSNINEKFEFYKNVVFYTLNNDLQTIILFPSNYYLEDFYNYIFSLNLGDEKISFLKEKLAIYSGEVDLKERYKIWILVRNKFLNVILSTKIGVFLPFDNVKIVLVDEPDNAGFRNPNIPMYNVYDVLNLRAKNKKLIFSSFVPSVVLMYENKKFVFYKNSNDKNITDSINVSFVEKKVVDVIKTELYKFKQVIVLFPYKGYSRYYLCPVCKKIFLHSEIKSKKQFVCPQCGSKKIFSYGMGIEKFVGILKGSFNKDIVIEHFDADTKPMIREKIINEFNKNKVDVLVATSEVFNYIYRINFQNVGSIYFAYLDGLLKIFGPLSYENIYIMIEIFKILLPKNFKTNIYLEIFKKHKDINRVLFSYNKFYKSELKIRRELNYPPYCKIMKLEFVYSDKEKDIIEKICEKMERIEGINFYILDSGKQIEKNQKITSAIVKIPNQNISSIRKLIEILESYVKDKTKILVYISYGLEY